MAASEQNSSFLPSIKCSNCGSEIEISRMGDHVCSQRTFFRLIATGIYSCSPTTAPAIRQQPFSKFTKAFSSMSVNRAAPTPLRPRQLPPKIDLSAASTTTSISSFAGWLLISYRPILPHYRSTYSHQPFQWRAQRLSYYYGKWPQIPISNAPQKFHISDAKAISLA